MSDEAVFKFRQQQHVEAGLMMQEECSFITFGNEGSAGLPSSAPKAKAKGKAKAMAIQNTGPSSGRGDGGSVDFVDHC